MREGFGFHTATLFLLGVEGELMLLAAHQPLDILAVTEGDKDAEQHRDQRLHTVKRIVEEEDETSRDIAYYLISGIMLALCNVANELHRLNEQLDRPLVVDNIGK